MLESDYIYLSCIDLISFTQAFDEGKIIGSIRPFYLKGTSNVEILSSLLACTICA